MTFVCLVENSHENVQIFLEEYKKKQFGISSAINLLNTILPLNTK